MTFSSSISLNGRRVDDEHIPRISIAFLTLHVGWGTFKPVGEEELREGRLHEERFRIPAETLETVERTKSAGGRVIAVGTTVVRTLETFAQRLATLRRCVKRFEPRRNCRLATINLAEVASPAVAAA